MATNDASPLTPEALTLVRLIAEKGSFAAAARELGRVPSALTYSIRQLEEALDVLLFDRKSRQAKLTPAGEELVREGIRLLSELELVAQRVKRVSTGWESTFTIAVDMICRMPVVLDLVAEFQKLNAPTRIRIRRETLSGTWETLARGHVELAIGVISEYAQVAGVQSAPLGVVPFVFVVSPDHPLAKLPDPISDNDLLRHTAVVVADSAQHGPAITVGVLAGQPTLTMPSLELKRQAQVRGLGVGFLPQPLVQQDIAEGRLIEKRLERTGRLSHAAYAWRVPKSNTSGRPAPLGPALSWWLERLEKPATRKALIG
jgi:DNA-binding transcriptional LysR family regulator